MLREPVLNEADYLELCNACDEILLDKNAGLQTIAIPWLHILNEHPVNLKRYSPVFSNKSIPRFASINSFLRLLYIKLRIFLCSYKFSFSIYPAEPIDVLFVSHLLNKSQAPIREDFYFGSIPYDISDYGLSSSTLLIDHTDGVHKNIELQNLALNFSKYILCNVLPLYYELRNKWVLKKEAKRLLRASKNLQDGLLKKVICYAAHQAQTSGAIANLRIYHQIKNIIRSTRPKALILTYEGHGWERIIFFAAREVDPNIKCFGYQHTIIFQKQHAMSRLLGKAWDPDVLLMPGMIGSDFLESVEQLSHVKKIVIGTHRKKTGVINFTAKRKNLNNASCLVIPDGTLSETIFIINFSIQVAKLMPDMTFIIRMHPVLLNLDLSKFGINSSIFPANMINTVNSDIEKDFFLCGWSIYRGSSAVIHAICSGLRPIYLAKPAELSIDPLVGLNSWRVSVSNPYECSDFIKSDITSDSSNVNFEWKRALEYSELYFQKLDISELIKEIKTL